MKSGMILVLSSVILDSAPAMVEWTVKCHETDRYFVVQRQPKFEVGTDFLVKYKSNGQAKPACEYVKAKGDFEILNEWAEYFMDLKGDLLILDSGTLDGLRGLIIWDLVERKKVFEGGYSWADIREEYMEYWMYSGVARKEDCEEFDKWGGALVLVFVRLDFSDFSIKKTDKTRCIPDP